MQLFFRNADGQTMTVSAEESMTIGDLKSQIASATQIPVDVQRLVFNSKDLEEGSLESNMILDGCFIDLNMRLVGGAGSSEMPDHLRELATHYKVDKMICRKCYARLPPKAYNCRKRKCGHSADLRPKKAIK